MSETHSQKRSVGETINTWMQIVGICIAAAWGVYTFVFKEITVPKSAPVNISINLQLKKLGTGSSNKANLMAVEMNISATNPSTREIHLLTSAWSARGIRIGVAERDQTNFTKAIEDALRESNGLDTVQRHAVAKERSMVAAGPLFVDADLKPNEKVARTIIIYVPRDDYDFVEVSAAMPSAEGVSRIALEWVFDKEYDDLKPVFYRVNKNGNRTPIKESDASSDKRVKLQWTLAGSQISLWP
jgi:hypothetical protein